MVDCLLFLLINHKFFTKPKFRIAHIYYHRNKNLLSTIQVSDIGDNTRPKNEDMTLHFTTNEIFNSREDLISWCQDKGRQLKVVVVTRKSDSGHPKRQPRILLGCERGGEYRRNKIVKSPFEKGSRKTGTKKCGCPFLLKGICKDNGTWKVDVQCGTHNHDIDYVLLGHSYAGRLKKDEISTLEEMSKSGVPPRQILSTIKNRNTDNQSTKKHIYNARSKLRLLELQGMSCMQYTLTKLAENKYLYYVASDEERNVVTQIFWCNPDSLNLLKCFPNVLVLDCTYKTNRYKMPLFEIVGIASTGKTFNVAFVFMEKEKEENYVWALERLQTLLDSSSQPKVFVTDKEQALINAIGKVFPSVTRILCKWHVSKNIVTNCKKHFQKEKEWENYITDWESLVNVEKEDEFANKIVEFENRWRAYPQCNSYVRSNWLPHKEYFVAAWTKRVMHLGATTTQRVESAHGKLKNHIRSSTASFPLVWQAMHSMISLQLWDIYTSFEFSKIRPKHEHNDLIFKELRGNISLLALNIICKERDRGYNFVEIDASICGCTKKITHGLPCAHELREYIQKRIPIPLSSIHPHWKQLSKNVPTQNSNSSDLQKDIIDDLTKVWESSTEDEHRVLKRKFHEILNPSTTLLSEPIKKEDNRGRPKNKKTASTKSKKSTTSTKRDPSGFEYAKTIEEEQASQASVSKGKKLPVKRGQLCIGSGVGYLPNITTFIQPFIRQITDVPMDGHCGFHAIAIGLKIEQQEAWKQVRHDLVNELSVRREIYNCLWGGDESTKHLKALEWYGPAACENNWFDTPAHCVLVANWYNCAFFIISSKGCSTFLPFFTAPINNFETNLFGLAYIEEARHFVHVEFFPTAPIPPVNPYWKFNRLPIAEAWIAPLKLRMEAWKIKQMTCVDPTSTAPIVVKLE